MCSMYVSKWSGNGTLWRARVELNDPGLKTIGFIHTKLIAIKQLYS